MSSNYLEDLSVLYPQIPTSIDDTAGLLRALENGTEEVNHLLRNSCNLLLECRCCKSIFRHAINFHKHKLSVCRAYHQTITPTYEQILAFHKEVQAMWNSEQPSTSEQVDEAYEEHSAVFEIVEDEADFIDGYEGIEEFCGESNAVSPEPGLFLEQEETTFYENNDEIEDGEYIGCLSTDNCHSTQSLFKVSDEGSDVFDQIDSSNTGESDTISLTGSPERNGQLNFPIFNDQLLESPTHTDYFGKGDKITIVSPIQME